VLRNSNDSCEEKSELEACAGWLRPEGDSTDS